MSETRWVARVRALIADDDGRVLVLEQDGRTLLPSVEIEGTDDELNELGRAALAALTGFGTVVVRSLVRSVDGEQKVAELGLELEPVATPSSPAPGAVWRTGEELAGAELADDDRSLVGLHSADRPPPERPDWMRRGFFAEASAWIDDALASQGRERVGPVEQISNWCISSILRAGTEAGRVYFKATADSPLFVDEGTVTRGLAKLLPGSVPAPIAIDAERRWMLLDEFGPLVGWKADLETRLDVLATFARIQREAAPRNDELLALGVFDRRPAWLAAEIEKLADSAAMLGLEAAEAEDFVGLVPRFVEACERLAAGAVPDSLVHGDLHLANVAHDGDGYVFFDWTDACLTHPFFDLLVVLFEDDADLRRALTNAYLGVWADHASTGELHELWRLAEPLASLNQAVSYRSILENVERGTASELEPMTAVWLRRALAAARAWSDDPEMGR